LKLLLEECTDFRGCTGSGQWLCAGKASGTRIQQVEERLNATFAAIASLINTRSLLAGKIACQGVKKKPGENGHRIVYAVHRLSLSGVCVTELRRCAFGGQTASVRKSKF
jgi:hypothetical protein